MRVETAPSCLLCSTACPLYVALLFTHYLCGLKNRLFLLGLEKYGKGDWRSISRNFVVTRTPTQVASHAQKYFIRLNSMNKDRRRSSIHDITSVNNGDVPGPQLPITGHTNGPAMGGKSNKPMPENPVPAPGISMYGPPSIGQPIGGPLVSAVGTPVNLPPPPQLAYGVVAPVPMAYPVPRWTWAPLGATSLGVIKCGIKQGRAWSGANCKVVFCYLEKTEVLLGHKIVMIHLLEWMFFICCIKMGRMGLIDWLKKWESVLIW